MNIFLSPDDEDSEVDAPTQGSTGNISSAEESVIPLPHTVDCDATGSSIYVNTTDGAFVGDRPDWDEDDQTTISDMPLTSQKDNLALRSSKQTSESMPKVPASTTTPVERDTSLDDKQKVVIDPRMIDLLEARVNALVDELLEVEGMGIIKKNIVSLLCKSVGIFFNGTFIKWMQHQSKSETVTTQICSLLTLVRDIFWPNDILIAFSAAEKDEAVLKEIDKKLRTECITSLNTLLPNILQVI
jgi:hypothetical protein